MKMMFDAAELKLTCHHYIIFYTGIITYINLRSVKLYVRINNFCSFGKVLACLIIIIGGIYKFAGGHTENLQNGWAGTTTRIGSATLAFYNGLWAYDGWSSVTIVTEEIKRPEKCVVHIYQQSSIHINPMFLHISQKYTTINIDSSTDCYDSVCAHQFGLYDCSITH